MPDDLSCTTGQGLAFLYRTHKTRLQRLVGRRLADPSHAEDVTHEAFVRLAARSDLLVAANPVAMLTRIAVNIIRDGFRMDRYRDGREAELRDHILRNAPHSPDPEHHAAQRQDLARLRDAIQCLPPRCREVFILHKVHGLSHSEVAQHLGISRNMVEKHVIRAYGHLRRGGDWNGGQG